MEVSKIISAYELLKSHGFIRQPSDGRVLEVESVRRNCTSNIIVERGNMERPITVPATLLDGVSQSLVGVGDIRAAVSERGPAQNPNSQGGVTTSSCRGEVQNSESRMDITNVANATADGTTECCALAEAWLTQD